MRHGAIGTVARTVTWEVLFVGRTERASAWGSHRYANNPPPPLLFKVSIQSWKHKKKGERQIFDNESDKQAEYDTDITYTNEDAVVVSEVIKEYEIKRELTNVGASELQVLEFIRVKFEIKNGKEF